jgi:hypothetical protein
MRRSDAQAAEISVRFRDANEKIFARAVELGIDEEPIPFLCECAEAGCTQLVILSLPAYEEARRLSNRFVVLPGHEEPIDIVVDHVDRYLLIEKVGLEGHITDERDPRT